MTDLIRTVKIPRQVFNAEGNPVSLSPDKYVSEIKTAIQALKKEYMALSDMTESEYNAQVDVEGPNKPFDEVHSIGGDLIIQSESKSSTLHTVSLFANEPIVVEDD